MLKSIRSPNIVQFVVSSIDLTPMHGHFGRC